MSEVLVLKDVRGNEHNLDEFVYEPELISGSVYEFNKLWHDRWYMVFTKRFSENAMYKRIKEVEAANEEFAKNIEIVLKANDKLFEENVQLGEIIEGFKRENLILTEKVKEMKRKLGTKPKGLLDFTGKMITARIVADDLMKENARLKESQSQMAPISDDVIKQVIHLKAKGLKNIDIANKIGISQATVSRYCNKYRKEIEMERM